VTRLAQRTPPNAARGHMGAFWPTTDEMAALGVVGASGESLSADLIQGEPVTHAVQPNGSYGSVSLLCGLSSSLGARLNLPVEA
jgi:hypothetical protein